MNDCIINRYAELHNVVSHTLAGTAPQDADQAVIIIINESARGPPQIIWIHQQAVSGGPEVRKIS